VNDSTFEEHVALTVLLRTRPDGLKWPEIVAQVLEHGSAVTVRDKLIGADLLPSAESVAAQEDLQTWRDAEIQFVSILDADYPSRLRGIHEAPPFLFMKGAPRADDIGVSVVGSRKASDRGLQMAAAIAQTLVSMNVSVISGLAAGIDAAAHTACLEAGGRPVGVIGTGINLQYPAANRELHARVADEGLLLSQFWPDQPPQKHTFPMRNATMSGYGIATVVVEAGEHSGARIQARVAVQHGRPVILTDSVIENNNWAKDLVGQPGVHPVASIADVQEIVSALVDEPKRVGMALDSLLTA
jgi:DNA processing protein